jgi:hypothetical protein
MEFAYAGRKVCDDLAEGDWIISNQEYVQVVKVKDHEIITTGHPRMIYGRDYEYSVYVPVG